MTGNNEVPSQPLPDSRSAKSESCLTCPWTGRRWRGQRELSIETKQMHTPKLTICAVDTTLRPGGGVGDVSASITLAC